MKKGRIYSFHKLNDWARHILIVSVRFSLKEGQFRVSTDLAEDVMIPVKNIAMLDCPWAPSQVCRGLYLRFTSRIRFFCTKIISTLPVTPPWQPLFLCVRTSHKRGWKSGSVNLWGNCRVGTTEQSWTWSHSAWDTSPAMRWVWTSEKLGSLTDRHLPWCPKQPVELDSHFKVEKRRPLESMAMSENKDIRTEMVRQYDSEMSFHILLAAVSKLIVLHSMT